MEVLVRSEGQTSRSLNARLKKAYERLNDKMWVFFFAMWDLSFLTRD